MDFNKLKDALAQLDEELVFEILKSVMDAGGEGVDSALQACQDGMTEVGNLFEAKEYFVADLIFAGEIMAEAMEIIRPALQKGDGGQNEKMILCTVEGDLHDIGKNIVKSILEASGFDVLDLGIDTPAEKIISTAREEGIRIIGLSGVLTLAIDAMKKTVDEFAGAGMRDDVRIIIGGSPVTQEVCDMVGADAWAVNPRDTAEICRGWV